MKLAPLLSLLLIAPASALIVAAADKDKDKEVDRFGQFKAKPNLAYVASGLIVGAATGVQVMTPSWLQNQLGSACESGIGAMCLRSIECLEEMKRSNPLGLTLGHGIITKACADVLARN